MKVLALVNGFGLGNATRCEPVLAALASRGHRIDVASSANGLAFFRARPYPERLIELRRFDYGKPSDRGISAIALLLSLPRSLANVFSNAILVTRFLKCESYDLVLTDSDYSALVFKWFVRVPVVAINNSQTVLRESISNRPPVRLWPQLMVEIFDWIYHRTIPDLTLCPAIEPRARSRSRIVEIPLLSRLGRRREKAPNAKPHAVFVFSSSNLGHDAKPLVEQCLGEITTTVISADNRANPDGSLKDIASLLLEADLIVSNAGMGTISDAATIRTPLLLLPIEGHCEQWANARIVSRCGFGASTTTESFKSKFDEMMMGLAGYRAAFERPHMENRDATEVALREIADLLRPGESRDERPESHGGIAMDLQP